MILFYVLAKVYPHTYTQSTRNLLQANKKTAPPELGGAVYKKRTKMKKIALHLQV